MVNKSKKVILLTAACSVLFSGSVMAASTSWTNTGTNEVDRYYKPSSGTMTSTKNPAGYPTVSSNLSFKFTTAQTNKIKQHQSFLITYDVRDNFKTNFHGYFISTTLPDPKYDYEDDNGDGRTDELEVVVKDNWGVEPNKTYTVDTGWEIKSSNGSPQLVSYASLSTLPFFPGGDYNTQPGTSEVLAGYKWNTDTRSIPDTTISKIAESKALNNITESKVLNNNEQYKQINSIQELDSYREAAHKKINELDQNESIEFVLTFAQPISSSIFNSVLQDSKIDVDQWYARGYNVNNEVVTIGSNQTNENTIERIIVESSNSFEGFTEIHGKAEVKTLKKLLENSNVYSIEPNVDKSIANGLSWKLENFSK